MQDYTYAPKNIKMLFAASGLCLLNACSTTPPKRFVSEPIKRDDCLIVQEERIVEGEGDDQKTLSQKTTPVSYSTICEDEKIHRLKMKIASDLLLKSFVDPNVAPEIKTKLAEKILKSLGSYDSAMRRFVEAGMVDHGLTTDDLYNPKGVFSCDSKASVYVDDNGHTHMSLDCGYN